MKMRTLIVDDEPLAREGMALALSEAADVEIVGSCPDGPSAVHAIRELSPDLVLLDIKMPGLGGFEVIEQIGAERMPAVIFLTAYEEHALRAFRVNAIDYLLKPLDGEELRRSLERARRRIAHEDVLSWGEQLRGLLGSLRSGTAQAPDTPNTHDRIVVRTGGRVHLLDPGEVVWVEASGDYVTVHTAEKSHLVRDSMTAMQSRLAGHGFQRIHRSTLVKLSAVRELIVNESGDGQAVLHDGTALRLSRTYRNALYARLNVVP